MDDLIPVKGYATFDPLKHCWVGSGFNVEMFRPFDIYKNDIGTSGTVVSIA